MGKNNFYYLIHLQYLGFRYHGWQRQPGVKTVQHMVEKTLQFVLKHTDFKILAAGRTDAKVSAEKAAFELFIDTPLDCEWLLEEMNLNLPGDIRLLSVEEVDQVFNIIQNPRVKEYTYLFSHGSKNHPFCAPFMVSVPEHLDIQGMEEAALLFAGIHDFKAFCTSPSEDTQTEREVILSQVEINTEYTANFFPAKSFIYRVKGKGFLRHQIRMMMGALFAVGKGELSQETIFSALQGRITQPLAPMAPPSGLMLRDIKFS